MLKIVKSLLVLYLQGGHNDVSGMMDSSDGDRIPLVIYGGVGADRSAREIAQLLRVLKEEMGFDSEEDIAFYRTDPEPGMPVNAFGAC